MTADPSALVRDTRKALGLSVQRFADAVGILNERTVRRWETGSQSVPGPVLVLCWIWGRADCPVWAKPPWRNQGGGDE